MSQALGMEDGEGRLVRVAVVEKPEGLKPVWWTRAKLESC